MKEEMKKLAPPFHKMSKNDQKKRKILYKVISHDLLKNKLCEPLNIKKDYLVLLMEAFVD
jgi:hypothetical protein